MFRAAGILVQSNMTFAVVSLAGLARHVDRVQIVTKGGSFFVIVKANPVV